MAKECIKRNNGGENSSSNKQQINTPARTNGDFYNPYTFIPLSDKVYQLSEQDEKDLDYCHDIPFRDGVSGNIEVSFKAITPLCVRSQQEENTKIGEKYYIPATSMKGMIRNIFEIITLSNIREGMADDRYSMRDMHSQDYQLKNNTKPQRSGFLLLLDGRYYIAPCTCQKYTYKEIQEHENAWIKNDNISTKYQKLHDGHIFETEDLEWCMWFFSGNMNNKKHEYLFTIPTINKSNLIPLEDNEYQDFIFIHEKENKNEGWEFWKKKLKNYYSTEAISKDEYKGIIPCFFRTKLNEAKQSIVKDLGFSFLYRQPYDKTLYDCLPENYRKDGIDLAQAVFGYTLKKKSLKGRVQFTHSFIAEAKEEAKQTFILSSPKPTYYPFYLKQDQPGRLNTYFSNNARIAGWKRPLVHGIHHTGNIAPSSQTTSFTPLASGCEFKTVIKIHNLRRYELGALLAAITFCNQQNECFHSLGIAKTMGFGKLQVTQVKLNVKGNIPESNEVTTSAVFSEFKTKLCNTVGMNPEKWLEYCKPLFIVASGEYDSKPIIYPELEKFSQIKSARKSLKDFSPKIL